MAVDRAIATHICGWTVLQRADLRVLLARRSGVPYGEGLWGLPGGHAEVGEPWAVAAARETLEEVGVTVNPDELQPLGIGRYLDDGIHGVDAFFLATTWQGTPEPLSECSEVSWFAVNDLPHDVLPWLPTSLEVHLKRKVWLHEAFDGGDGL